MKFLYLIKNDDIIYDFINHYILVANRSDVVMWGGGHLILQNLALFEF